MVFLYHLQWIAGEPALPFLGVDWRSILTRFDWGVCLFFVLSGYLLSGPFWEGMISGRWPDLKKYATRRVARIMPAYWLLLLAIPVLASSTYSLWGGIALMLQITGLHTFADYFYNGSVPVLWSIGIELQYYVLLPLLFISSHWIARKNPWLAGSLLAALILLSDPAWRLIAQLGVGKVPAKILPTADSRVITASVFFYLKWFAMGIFGARLAQTLRARWERRRIVWDLTFVGGIATAMIVIAFSHEGEWRTISHWGWPISPLAGMLMVVSAPSSRAAAALLENSPLRFLGRISYGLYLWHWPIQKAVFAGTLPLRFGLTRSFFICGFISLLVTCLVASLSYLFIERRAIEWAKAYVPSSLRGLALQGAMTGAPGALRPSVEVYSSASR